jgi:hypothetical protein
MRQQFAFSSAVECAPTLCDDGWLAAIYGGLQAGHESVVRLLVSPMTAVPVERCTPT